LFMATLYLYLNFQGVLQLISGFFSPEKILKSLQIGCIPIKFFLFCFVFSIYWKFLPEYSADSFYIIL
jgi:hypothetical protein